MVLPAAPRPTACDIEHASPEDGPCAEPGLPGVASPSTVAAVMVHVPAHDVAKARRWYAAIFPASVLAVSQREGFEFIRIGAIQLEIVPADEKVGCGAAGSVVYWETADFAADLKRLLSAGASLYRGPMAIEADRVMCQVRDPWGNCIGLRGRRR